MGFRFSKSRVINSSCSTNLHTAVGKGSGKSTSTQYPGPCVTQNTDASLTIQFRGTNINLLGNVLCECDSVLVETPVEPPIPSLSSSLAMLAGLAGPEHTSRLLTQLGSPAPAPTRTYKVLNVALALPALPLSSHSLISSENSTFEQTVKSAAYASQSRTSLPSGTIAAIVLAGVLAILIAAFLSYYFLRYRPRRRRTTNNIIPIARIGNDPEEPKNDVLDISAEAVARQQALDQAELRQWVEAAEGRSNGRSTLSRLGLTFKKSSSSSNPGEDRASRGSVSDRSSYIRGDSAGRTDGRGKLIWKRSWGSLSRRHSPMPSQTIELEHTRSISTVEDDKENDDTESLRFAPILNGIPYTPPRPMPHPYTNTVIPQLSVQPPTAPSSPQSPSTHVHVGGHRPSSQAVVTSSSRADFRPDNRGSHEHLASTSGSFTSVVRSLSPRISETLPQFLRTDIRESNRRPDDSESGDSGSPIDSHGPLGARMVSQTNNQASVASTSTEPRRLSVHFREGTKSIEENPLSQSKQPPRLDTLALPGPFITRCSSSASTYNRVTSFLDLDASSKESSVKEQNGSSPTSLRHPSQPGLIPSSHQRTSTGRPDLSWHESKSGWLSSTPSSSSQPSPIDTSRWSDSIGVPARNITGSGDSSSAAPSSVFPYPVSLPPSPHYPEHVIRRQPSAVLLPTNQSPRIMIPSDVPLHSSRNPSTSTSPVSPTLSAQPSEIHFRNPDDITDIQETSDISSHASPTSRPPISASDSYIVQRVLGRSNVNTSLTPIGRGVDSIP